METSPGSSGARVTLHSETSATVRDVGNHRCTTMNLGNTTKIDRKGQFHQGPLGQSEVRCLDEYPVRAQVARSAQLAFPARSTDVDRRAGPMPCVQTTFHRADPRDRVVGLFL